MINSWNEMFLQVVFLPQQRRLSSCQFVLSLLLLLLLSCLLVTSDKLADTHTHTEGEKRKWGKTHTQVLHSFYTRPKLICKMRDITFHLVRDG